MDTFMDKLAQKLTAQEMIKANAAADAEEIDRLHDQIKEYNQCLEEMRKVNQETRSAAAQLNRLMEETIEPQVRELAENAVAKLENAKVDTGEIDRLVQESLAKIKEIQKDEAAFSDLQEALGERFSQTEEYVHKENVKVYRNVQAVVTEENGKQNEVLEKAVTALTGKLNVVLGIAIASLVAAGGGIVFQLLAYFHII